MPYAYRISKKRKPAMNIFSNRQDGLALMMVTSIVVGLASVSCVIGFAMAAGKLGNDYLATVVVNGGMVFWVLGVAVSMVCHFSNKPHCDEAVENAGAIYGIVFRLMLGCGVIAVVVFGGASLLLVV